MMIVPFVVGVILRSRVASLDAWLLPLAAAELAAYLCFNALTFWLRAAPSRRHTYTRPVVVYGLAAAASGGLAMALGAWPMLAWLPVALPMAALAIWLASQRRDRDVLSGLATVALAVGMGLVTRFVTPAGLLDDWPSQARDALVMLGLFGYFFGTVWHVKALIRERGQRRARWRTLLWHAVMVGLAALGAVTGWTSGWWIVFFTITTLRSWWMTRPHVSSRLKPLQIGVTEIVLSLVALAISLT